MVEPLAAGNRQPTLAIEDTPTLRHGPYVQGAGVHHNPAPGPAGAPFVYGHVFFVLCRLRTHPAWGVVPLLLLSRLYLRRKNLPAIGPKHRPGRAIRAVLVDEPAGWSDFFSTDSQASVADVLTAVADRFPLEISFRDVKEVVGAGQQRVRFVWVSLGALQVCLWAFTPDRSVGLGSAGERDGGPLRLAVGHAVAPAESPRTSAARRRELLVQEIRAVLRPGVTEEEIQAAAEGLLGLTA